MTNGFDPQKNAVRIVEVEPTFTVEQPGAEFAFGASTAGALTLAHVHVRVADASGREADGWGAIFLSHPWAFPGTGPGAAKDALMRGIIEALGTHLVARDETGHPLDHFLSIEPELGAIAGDVATAHGIAVDVPPLCTLVCLSPIDAAIHDAYGRLHGVNAFDALGPGYVGWDLSRVLGDDFAGRYLSDVIRGRPVDAVPVSHTVGPTDPLTPEDAVAESAPALTEWIARDGVFSFKVKLKGKDLDWDASRLIDVYRLASRTPGAAGPVRIFGDLNEQGPSMAYILALIDGVRTRSPEAFAALDALEQPAPRDLGEGAVFFGDAAARVPIVLDEGLTSLAMIDRAVALGWNGIALKTCKTQSLMLLAIAKARGLGLQISVQDLTNPGIALLQSVALASRLPEIVPMETNQRQYSPRTSVPEAAVYPEVFSVRQGRIPAHELTGPGLGYDVGRIDRDVFRSRVVAG
jgi:L-alanine-DL-glutamate epimerase-like enolase superfamily enzyme